MRKAEKERQWRKRSKYEIECRAPENSKERDFLK